MVASRTRKRLKVSLVILLLGSAGLLVGGVGVVGIMLISVTERTREIGVRKAVGATRREILWQFLVEASLLTVSGAAVGMLVGGTGNWNLTLLLFAGLFAGSAVCWVLLNPKGTLFDEPEA